MRTKTFVRLASSIGLTGLGLATLVAACSSDRPKEPEPVARAMAAITQERPCQVPTTPGAPCGMLGRTIALSVPEGGNLSEIAVMASNSLKLGDRVQVTSVQGAPTPVVNLGAQETEVGVEAVIGNLQSVGNVVLRDRATVAGFVQTSGILTIQNGATVEGPILEDHQLLDSMNEVSWPVFVANESRPGVQLEADQEMTLSPGAYGSLRVASRAILNLSSGTYSFDSVQLEPDSEVRLSTDAGPALINVFEAFTNRGRFIKVGADPNEILVSYVGTSPAWIQAPFEGTIVAPEAKLDPSPIA